MLSRGYKNMASGERHNIEECKEVFRGEYQMSSCTRACSGRIRDEDGCIEGDGRVCSGDIAERTH